MFYEGEIRGGRREACSNSEAGQPEWQAWHVISEPLRWHHGATLTTTWPQDKWAKYSFTGRIPLIFFGTPPSRGDRNSESTWAWSGSGLSLGRNRPNPLHPQSLLRLVGHRVTTMSPRATTMSPWPSVPCPLGPRSAGPLHFPSATTSRCPLWSTSAFHPCQSTTVNTPGTLGVTIHKYFFQFTLLYAICVYLHGSAWPKFTQDCYDVGEVACEAKQHSMAWQWSPVVRGSQQVLGHLHAWHTASHSAPADLESSGSWSNRGLLFPLSLKSDPCNWEHFAPVTPQNTNTQLPIGPDNGERGSGKPDTVAAVLQ